MGKFAKPSVITVSLHFFLNVLYRKSSFFFAGIAVFCTDSALYFDDVCFFPMTVACGKINQKNVLKVNSSGSCDK